MITPFNRSPEDIYEAIITDEQNPIVLRFRYRKEAVAFQQEFYTGLEEHNYYVHSEIRCSPVVEYIEVITLTFWR